MGGHVSTTTSRFAIRDCATVARAAAQRPSATRWLAARWFSRLRLGPVRMGVNSSLLRLLLIRLTAWISITSLCPILFGNAMARRDQAGGSQHATHAQFQSTHWSLVL